MIKAVGHNPGTPPLDVQKRGEAVDSFIDVEVSSLLVFPFDQMSLLPEKPGIYFILASSKHVLYIGESADIKERFRGAHDGKARAKQFQPKEIAVLTSDDYPELAGGYFRGLIEKHLVRVFWPICNSQLPTARKLPISKKQTYVDEWQKRFSEPLLEDHLPLSDLLG